MVFNFQLKEKNIGSFEMNGFIELNYWRINVSEIIQVFSISFEGSVQFCNQGIFLFF